MEKTTKPSKEIIKKELKPKKVIKEKPEEKKVKPKKKFFKVSNFFNYITVICVIIFFCVILFFTSIYMFYSAVNQYTNISGYLKSIILKSPTVYDYLDELKVNDIVKYLLIRGHGEKIFSFYDKWTNDREISMLLVNTCILIKTPLHKTFALVKEESGFRKNAVNDANSNGTTDRGLFQLNSGSYKNYTREELLHPEINIRLGCEHFLEEYNKQKKHWNKALVSYNKGSFSSLTAINTIRLFNILDTERELNIKFLKFLNTLEIDWRFIYD